jgi:hypothetical protein
MPMRKEEEAIKMMKMMINLKEYSVHLNDQN